MPSLVTLSDVLGTGHHAAVVAGVAPGTSVAVVGDGAVGLCGVIAAGPGGAVGRVGVPQDPTMPGSQTAFYKNVTVGGDPALNVIVEARPG